MPLGVNAPGGGGVPFEEVTRPLAPGSTLVLCTDGLVERPGTDIGARIDVLTHTVDAALKGAHTDPDTLDRAAERLIRTLIADTAVHDDDVTLLMIGVPAPDGTGADG
ncbi:hypothetical protein GCM10010255_65200 [Streptomyces coeruleofuscus]|uniref:PPM-type phosphatase domain-containing protein n=1 Tax=Streptomyces coeruleofuscus TaxID=66879 RepID=A0ABP5W1B5_9ACTN